MCLFTPVSNRSKDTKPYNEGAFSYLNRSGREPAHQIRELLDGFYRNFGRCGQNSDAERSRLQSEFRSSVESQHFAAFWELLLHETFLRLGFEVLVHQPLPSSSTVCDFQLRRDGQIAAVVEAVSMLAEDDRDQAASNRLNDVLHTIGGWTSPSWWVMAECDIAPPSPPPIKKQLKPRLFKWLDSLDRHQVHQSLHSTGGMIDLPSFDYEWNGWHLQLTAWPKKVPSAEGSEQDFLGGTGSISGKCSQAVPLYKKTISKKIGKYPNLPGPFIVAANTLETPFDRNDELDLLFGRESVSIKKVGNSYHPGKPHRGTDGLFIRRMKPINTRVAGIMLSNAHPWTLHTNKLTVYENPYCSPSVGQQMDSQTFQRLANCRANDAGQLQFTPGLSFQELFDLPDAWPGFAEDSEG